MDSFSALFESATLGISLKDWLERYEKKQIRQKSLQNHIGKLHEVAISCFDNWDLNDSAADVEFSKLLIIAEIKNKYNTMNQGNQAREIIDT